MEMCHAQRHSSAVGASGVVTAVTTVQAETPLLVRDGEATAGARGCGQPWLSSSALCTPCISGW